MSPFPFLHELRLLLGIERNTTRHGEKWISGVGAAMGVLAVWWLTRWSLGDAATPAGVLMISSMGASLVLLVAVPRGPLSQPWVVMRGHLLAAAMGVTCQRLLPGHAWTAALAVGLAVGAMYYLRCIHPPGGATALTAVIGGPDIHALGYHYLLVPVLVNVLALLAMAVVFNAAFAWRRYPAHLHRRQQPSRITQPAQRQFELTQEDFSAAMEQLNSYVDITTENLTELLELAKQHAERNITHPDAIVPGRYYSNGKLGRLWSVRQLQAGYALVPDTDAGTAPLRYHVVAGDQAGQSGSSGADEFRQWARFEVVPQDNGRWVKAD